VPYQTSKRRHGALLVEAHNPISGQLELEVGRQPQQHVTVRLQSCYQTWRWPVAERLCHFCQHVAIRRFVTSPVWCAEEKDAQCGILDRLVLRLEPSLQ